MLCRTTGVFGAISEFCLFSDEGSGVLRAARPFASAQTAINPPLTLNGPFAYGDESVAAS